MASQVRVLPPPPSSFSALPVAIGSAIIWDNPVLAQMTLRTRALLSVIAAALAAVGFMFATVLVPGYSIVFGGLAFNFGIPPKHMVDVRLQVSRVRSVRI
jgi:hypothetical protein